VPPIGTLQTHAMHRALPLKLRDVEQPLQNLARGCRYRYEEGPVCLKVSMDRLVFDRIVYIKLMRKEDRKIQTWLGKLGIMKTGISHRGVYLLEVTHFLICALGNTLSLKSDKYSPSG